MSISLDLGKDIYIIFIRQREKPLTKVKKTREEMQATLEKRRKIATKFPRNALKRKNGVEEGGTSRLGVKKEQNNT
jgi:hypothetical protein